MKELLKRGASPNTVQKNPGYDDGGLTPLIVAARADYVDVARALIEAGADVNLRQGGGFDGNTPLIIAAATNHVGMTGLLLRHGANLNARTGLRASQPTALGWAVLNGHSGPAVVLLAEGAAIDRRDLQRAISKGYVDITRQLLDSGADPRWVFSDGLTALETAQRSPKETRAQMVEVVRLHMEQPRSPAE